MLRMRLLQSLVRPSYFIVVTRHPVAASLAAMKWTHGSIFSLLCHWVHCHDIAAEDSGHLDHVLWVSYERFVADPNEQLARIAHFLGLPRDPRFRLQLTNQNERYFAAWRTYFFADSNREIEQRATERRGNRLTRWKRKWLQKLRERAIPAHRRWPNLRLFYEAQDAVSLLEPAVNRFGYSFHDLTTDGLPNETTATVEAE
jgi:hypothetical protein